MKKSNYLIIFFSLVLLIIISPSKVNAEWVTMYQNSMNCGNTGNISTCSVVAGAFQDTFNLDNSSGTPVIARRFYYTSPITYPQGKYDYLLFTYYMRWQDYAETYSFDMNNVGSGDWESTAMYTWYEGYGFYASLDPGGSNCIVLDTSNTSPYKYFNVLCPLSNNIQQINSIYIRGLASFTFPGNHTIQHGVSGMMQFHVSDGSTLNEIIAKEEETADAVNDLNDSITSSDTNTDTQNQSTITNFNNTISENGTIQSLITMPIKFFQNMLNSVNGTCSPFVIGDLFGTSVTFPCINLSQILGSTLWGIIDVLCSGFFIWGMGKRFISIFENFTSLKDGKDEIGG